MPKGMMYNKSNGKEAMKQKKMEKDATKDKGRHNQPRGSAEHNTKPKMAKKMKNLENSNTMF